MSCEKNIYASLNVCQCEFNESLPQKKKVLNDLGGTTNTFLNIYLPANSAFISAMSDKHYPTNKLFNVPTITLGVNYGIIAYFFKKAEGKSDSRILGEIGIEMVATDTFGRGGKFLGNKIQEKIATKTATKLGVSLGSRILAGAGTGAAAGSSIPIART